MPCPKVHPVRAGLEARPGLDVIGSYATDSWVRCRECGRWFWLTTDTSSKWQYSDHWEIDRGLAERALRHADTGAAARLLVTSDLPKGPVWTSASALVDMLRAVTPTATDADRSRALLLVPPTGRWVEAARLLDEVAHAAPPIGPDMRFLLDLSLTGHVFTEWFEVGPSLVLLQIAPTPALVRIDASRITLSQADGPVHQVGHRAGMLLFGVTTAEGVAVGRFDAAGRMVTFPPSSTRYHVSDLDDGWWLFTPDDNAEVRYVEFHRPDAQPRVKLRMGFSAGTSHPAPPRRMGDGWVVSGCIDDEDRNQALTLLDASFKTLAWSEDARGQRLIEPIDESALWAETTDSPCVLERWQRDDRVFRRTISIDTQSWLKVRGGIVVAPRDPKRPITGYDDAGNPWFQLSRKRAGAAYFAEVADGVLVYDDARAQTIDPVTGADVADPIDVEFVRLLTGRDGTSYLRDRAALWVIGKERKRIYVGQGMDLETTCGEGAVLRDRSGNCLVVGPDGVRGRFAAPAAPLSVVGTNGGPYIVEPGSRIRVGAFAS